MATPSLSNEPATDREMYDGTLAPDLLDKEVGCQGAEGREEGRREDADLCMDKETIVQNVQDGIGGLAMGVGAAMRGWAGTSWTWIGMFRACSSLNMSPAVHMSPWISQRGR